MSRAASATDVFHAIADANRRDVLDLLAKGEVAVGTLVERIGLSYSALSQHLAVLLEAGLVRRRREGRQQFYRLNAAPLREVAHWASHYEPYWTERLDRLEAYFAEKKGRNS
ncbi:MAG TPA: metalloregulator ArsR/SmtB family transcription factor [Alphaproteobacteria bacterium]|nr:metalloregulator ArsR/SmtB family transcription factor [Alphaproteobacteria bacterium]